VLEDLGLPEALRVYIRQWAEHVNVEAQFHSTGFDVERPSADIENNLYRVAQEALNNVAKHAKASTVDILLERRGDYVVLIVEDNGVGFSNDELRGQDSHGLNGIRERASLLDGHLDVESSPGHGTTIFVRLPLNRKTESNE
jgi:signal transduction histidine kinase